MIHTDFEATDSTLTPFFLFFWKTRSEQGKLRREVPEMVWEQFDRVANDALSGGQLPFHKYKSDPSSHNPTVGVISYLLYLAPSSAFLAEPVEAAPVRGDAGHHRRRAVDRDAEDHPLMLITSLQHTTAATYPPTLLPRLAPLPHP